MAGTDLISREDTIDRINKQREHLQPDVYPQDAIGDAAYRICAEFIERLPSAERTVAHIRDFTQYQIAWLTAHDDLELEPELESWVIRFLKDTADCCEKEYLTSAERAGKWVEDKYGNILCSECNWSAPKVMVGCLADRHLDYEKSDYCWHCGARMVSEE